MRIVLTPRMPPPSMQSTRTPRLDTRRRPVAWRTSSFSPKIASARVAARFTSGSTGAASSSRFGFSASFPVTLASFARGDARGDDTFVTFVTFETFETPYTTRPPATEGSPPPRPSAYPESMSRA